MSDLIDRLERVRSRCEVGSAILAFCAAALTPVSGSATVICSVSGAALLIVTAGPLGRRIAALRAEKESAMQARQEKADAMAESLASGLNVSLRRQSYLGGVVQELDRAVQKAPANAGDRFAEQLAEADRGGDFSGG